jgi:hypothetical protein
VWLAADAEANELLSSVAAIGQTHRLAYLGKVQRRKRIRAQPQVVFSAHTGRPLSAKSEASCFNGVIDPITGDLLPDVVAALMNHP